MRVSRDTLFSLLATRGAEFIPRESLRRKLASGEKLRVKLGIDPTATELHLGHAVPLRSLKIFQDAGHTAVLIIGDFTAQIGDPAGTSETRRQLSAKEVRANERTYLRQIGRIIDLKRAEVHHNREWFSRMKLSEFFSVVMHFSLKSAWEREDFQKRLGGGKTVRLHEAFYHVLQGYDSVMVRADVEIGAVDQKLNLLAGRELQAGMAMPAQDIVVLPYLLSHDGHTKMSKSVGNTINLTATADDMFGKLMAIPDSLIEHYARLAAWLGEERVVEMKRAMARGGNPRDTKLDLAEAVVVLYHGAGAARDARASFMRTFSRREGPSAPRVVHLGKKIYHSLDLLKELGIPSRSQARRLLRGGAVELDGRVLHQDQEELHMKQGSTVRIGKKSFFRIG